VSEGSPIERFGSYIGYEQLGVGGVDVSPSNLIVSDTGVVKPNDFGTAKDSAAGMQTMTGTLKGKFAYMVPERRRQHATALTSAPRPTRPTQVRGAFAQRASILAASAEPPAHRRHLTIVLLVVLAAAAATAVSFVHPLLT
jgi:hypothetical protein